MEIINKEDIKNMLSIGEFIIKNDYNVKSIFVDKFYDNIKNDKWIYIDETLIEWIGYKTNGKQKYLNIIKQNFKEIIDYKIYNNTEFDKIDELFYSPSEESKKDEENRGGALKQHIILSPKCFKKSLMLLKTSKANLIIEHYMDLEDLCKDYMKYHLEELYKLLDLYNVLLLNY